MCKCDGGFSFNSRQKSNREHISVHIFKEGLSSADMWGLSEWVVFKTLFECYFRRIIFLMRKLLSY